MARDTKYTGSGVILLTKFKDDPIEYIVLVKRTKDADPNPDAHSGFFGGAKADETDPLQMGHREFAEELLIAKKDFSIVHSIYFVKKFKKSCQEIGEEFAKLWAEKLRIKKLPVIPKQAYNHEEVDYIECDGNKKIYVVRCDVPYNIQEIVFLDCEDKKKNDKQELLDRQIDLFDFAEFKNWWLDNKTDVLIAKYSYKDGIEKPRKGFISREKDKMSSSLILALNKWTEMS